MTRDPVSPVRTLRVRRCARAGRCAPACARARAAEFLRAAVASWEKVLGSGHSDGDADGAAAARSRARPELLVRLNFNSQEHDEKLWQAEVEATFGAADGYVLPKVRDGDCLLNSSHAYQE